MTSYLGTLYNVSQKNHKDKTLGGSLRQRYVYIAYENINV